MPRFVMVYGKSPDKCSIKRFTSDKPSNVVKIMRDSGWKVYYLRKVKVIKDAD